MKLLIGFTLVFVTLFATNAFAGWDPDAKSEARSDAKIAVAAFKKADPKLNRFFAKAYGYVIYPNIVKGAMGIGGAYGSGTVFQQGRIIGSSSLSQLSFGFQLGGQAYREIIFFKNRQAMARFKKGKFELGAQLSAVAATYGASANVDYSSGVAIFTIAKGGLMYEASVGGQVLSFDAR